MRSNIPLQPAALTRAIAAVGSVPFSARVPLHPVDR